VSDRNSPRAPARIRYGRGMERRNLPAILFFLTGMTSACFAIEPGVLNGGSDSWKLGSESSGVTLSSRLRRGSSLKEFKAVGAIDASTHVVHGVVDDFENYPRFMPYTAECRIVKRGNDSVLTYQRLSPKIVTDRDYTLRVRQKSWSGPGGLVYLIRWEAANEFGPAEKTGVLRVKLCEGGWLLEPDGANKTRATYSIYTDSGGAIPAFIANKISEIGIRKLFAAVRKQVQDPKYRAVAR
ncbi:MAG: SRPBCC family protein, partial [Verrucomicrobiota bacterium]